MKNLVSFYNFLKSPSLLIQSNEESLTKVIQVVSLFAIIFLLEVFVLFPLYGLLGVEDLTHALELLEDSISPIMIALLAIVAAPVIEEMIFRFPLRNSYLLQLLIIAFIGMSFFLIFGVFGKNIGIIAGVLSILLYGAYLVKTFKYQDIHRLSSRLFPYFFYIVAIFFAFIHLFNFQLDEIKWWMGPILVGPQFLLGLLLGYVRVKYGIMYSIMVHAMNNTIPIVLLNISKNLM